MSPGDAVVVAPMSGLVGEKVIAYLDLIGRIEGTILTQIDGGFCMTIAASPRKRDKMAAQLTWLANRQILNLPEDRRHDRIVPRNPSARILLADGQEMQCRIIDMSLSGAAISSQTRPEVGSKVTIGRVQAQVIRHLEDGFALEFAFPQLAETLEDNVTAR
jgi:hypothetical protein